MFGQAARLFLAGCLAGPAAALAQQPGPWTVALTPTMNPLPVGGCAAVHLTVVDPASRDVPRNPLGQRVTIADFDIVVTSPDGMSAAAQRSDAYHVSACGCQRAVPGTVVTVTATYPATELEESARVPNVEFQKTATFTLKEARGTFNPPECTTLASNPGPRTAPTLIAADRSAQRPRNITTKTLSLSGTNATGGITARVLNPARTGAVRNITTRTLILAGQK